MKGRKAMNWKKKLLALGLSLALTLSLTACGQKAAESEQPEEPAQTEEPAVEAPDGTEADTAHFRIAALKGPTAMGLVKLMKDNDETIGALLIRKFGEECQRRWGITPLQIFLHKDEGHWLNGQPKAEDKESFQVGNRWFKPNYHAHVVFDWMNHETGKSRKLNDEDMATMQTLASDILLMERGQSKAVTGKEHLERNDFIIEKQKAELQRIEETKRHKEQQVSLAEQELKQVKAEIRTDKLKSVATDAATAIASGVGSLFGSGKLKDLEQSNENLRHEIAKRDKGIDELKAKMQQMQEQHSKQIRNIQGIHNQELEAKDKEISRLNTILEKAFNWFPLLKEMLRMERLCYAIGFTKDMVNSLLTKREAIRCSGKLYSEEHRRKFEIKNDIFKVEKSPVDENKLVLTINRQPIGEWFKEQWEKLQQNLRNSVQREQKNRGFKL